MLTGNADLVYPNVVSLLVVLVNGGPEQVFGDFKSLCEELPSPRNSFFLEVIAKGEVAQHFKERAVAGGVTYALKVGGSDTLLAGGYSVARGNLLAREELLHRRHARVNKQKGFVIDRNQRVRGKSQMSL